MDIIPDAGPMPRQVTDLAEFRLSRRVKAARAGTAPQRHFIWTQPGATLSCVVAFPGLAPLPVKARLGSS